MSLPLRLYYYLLVALGRLIASVKLNHVEVGRQVRKRRKTFTIWAIPCINLVCDGLRVGIELLPRQSWLRHELHLHRQVLDRRCRIDNGTLITERLPGVCLRSYLGGETDSLQIRRALEAAVKALHQLHQQGHSHSDAALHNVFYEPQQQQARWFDFESRHHRTSLEWARAQDLMALSCSAAKAVGRSRVRLVAQALESYPCSEVKKRLGRLLQQWPRQPQLLLLVEAPWDHRCFQLLCYLLEVAPSAPGGPR